MTIDLRRLDEKLTKLEKTAKKALAEKESNAGNEEEGGENHSACEDARDQIQADRDEIKEE